MDMKLEGLSDKGNLLVCRNFFSHNGYFLVLAWCPNIIKGFCETRKLMLCIFFTELYKEATRFNQKTQHINSKTE